MAAPHGDHDMGDLRGASHGRFGLEECIVRGVGGECGSTGDGVLERGRQELFGRRGDVVVAAAHDG